MTALIVLVSLMVIFNVLAIILVNAGKGISITLNHNYHYPEQPKPVEIKQEEDDGQKAIIDAAQAIQAFFLDDKQMDLPEVKNNG